MIDIYFKPLTPTDKAWVRDVLLRSWGGEIVIVHDEIFRPAELPGFAAFSGKHPVWLLTYSINDIECEIVTLDSFRERQGIGTSLIEAIHVLAVNAGCRRLFLVTTNNNLRALRFYLNRGFIISGVHLNAISKSRKLKPQIPLVDNSGQPIRDEIEMEYLL